MRYTLAASYLQLVIILWTLGCGSLSSMDHFMPDANTVKAWLPDLYDRTLTYEGVYGATDIDMFIVTIRSATAGAALLGDLQRRLGTDWKPVASRGGVYYRMNSHGVLGGRTMQLVRMARVDRGTVLLGFAQADHVSSSSYADAITRHNELKVIDEYFWPRYEESLRGLRASTPSPNR